MIVNRQQLIRVSISDLEKFLTRVMKELRLPLDSLAVSLVSNAQIAKWNARYRRKDKPTDVLSFPAEESAQTKMDGRRPRRGANARSRSAASSLTAPFYLGDIAIAPAVAKRNAALYGRTFDQEMRILILHGILHLMGYDHETDQGQMDRRERRLRRILGLEGEAA